MGGKGEGASDTEKKQVCDHFEPQAWRKNLCKNCFRTLTEHNASKEKQEKVPTKATEEVAKTPKKKTADKKKNGEVLAGDKAASSSTSSSEKKKGKNENKPAENVFDKNDSAAKNERKVGKFLQEKHIGSTSEKATDIKGGKKDLTEGNLPRETSVNKVATKLNNRSPFSAGISEPKKKSTDGSKGIKKAGQSNAKDDATGAPINDSKSVQKRFTGSLKGGLGEINTDGPTGIVLQQDSSGTCDNHIEGNNKAKPLKAGRGITAAEVIGDKSRLLADKNTTAVQESKKKNTKATTAKETASQRGGAEKQPAVIEKADSIAGKHSRANAAALAKTTGSSSVSDEEAKQLISTEEENINSTSSQQQSSSTTSPSPTTATGSALNYATSHTKGSNNIDIAESASSDLLLQPRSSSNNNSSGSSSEKSRDSAVSGGDVVTPVPSLDIPPLQPPPPGKKAKGLVHPNNTPTTAQGDVDVIDKDHQLSPGFDEEDPEGGSKFARILEELKSDSWETSRNKSRISNSARDNSLDEEEGLGDRGRLLKESLTDISDVFEEPLSPKSLDRYRKELFDSDSNIASPKSPRPSKFFVDEKGSDGKSTSSRDSATDLSQEAGNVSSSLFYHSPEADRYGSTATTTTPTRTGLRANNQNNSSLDLNQGQSVTVYHTGETQDLGRTGAKKVARNRRRRQSWDHLDGWNPNYNNMAAHERTRYEVSRDEAMMEGTRMLMDNLRDKNANLEDTVNRMEREKLALSDLLSVKKEEYLQMKDHYSGKFNELEDAVKRLSSEKERLLDRLKLPESERGSLRDTEIEISKLNKKLEEAENRYFESMEENMTLKQEVKDLQTEIDEMHDQFRDDEQIEFRELQRELEMNAKNCRILQFKLRKSERRNEQLETDKMTLEESIRQLEGRFESSDDKQQIRELEEELKMAKEVSVRLHDELELVEEKRARYEEELDRVNDILTESENRRTALQKEVENLNAELESFSRGSKGKSFFKKDTLSKPSLEKQSSSEYDIRQVMRDLQDSLERENDLKEQMEFRDQELRTLKRKLSDIEGENESLTLQLQKMSSAKSGKYFKKSSDIMEKEIVTEREHELRLQMELAEQELKVQRRKMDELEMMNEKLMKELNRLEKDLTGGDKAKSTDKSGGQHSEEEKIRCMVKDIERLKWSLIEKDQEAADRQRRGSVRLKKSRSLEDDATPEGAEYHQDLRRQLETIQQEADILRQKVLNLERENDCLSSENKKLEILINKKQGGALPAITTDDAAVQNIELKARVKRLEDDNVQLRSQIRSLDERTSKLSQEVTRTLSRSYSESHDITEQRGLRNKLKTYEDECNHLKKKVTDLESKNSKLSKDLEERKHKKAKKDAKKEKEKERKEEVSKMSKDDLRHRVMQLEDELKDVRTAIKNREEENTRLEIEISEYREDMDRMFSSFRVREQELIEEMESLQNKNTVISNLLEIVTERAESTQKELYRSVREASRSPSAMSDLSGISAGSDEVFADGKETKIMEARLEEQFMKKIEWLERNLAEERQKVQAAERKLEMSGDHHSKSEEEKKLHQKEKDILLQEVSVAQNQLKDANKKVKELRSKVDKITEENERLKTLQKSKEQSDAELKKLKEDLEKEEKAKSKKSAAWIWEKQSLETELKDYKKKVEELHAEVKKQQFKWKLAGEDIEREQKQKLQMQEQLEQLKKSSEKSKTEIQGLKNKLDKSEEKQKSELEKWEKDKKSMERQQKQTEKEVRNKEDIIKQKDEIIKRKEDLITEKTSALMERDDKIHQYEVQLQTQANEMQKKSSKVLDLEKEMTDMKSNNKDLGAQIKDKDKKIKSLNEDIRHRDDRLHEKDDILNKLNRKLTDRETEVQDMDQTIRQAMKKLQDRENELKVAEKRCTEFESQASEFRTSTKELKEKVSDMETKHAKEISDVMKKREKLQVDLDSLKKEKKSLLSDLEDSKDKLNRENERLKKDKNRLEVEVKQANEKVHSMRMTGGMKESEALKTLTGEKDTLIAEKHKLKDELQKLKKDSKADAKKWMSEREDLEKTIAEKTKLVKDNSTTCDKLQREVEQLKQQISQESSRKTAIPVMHETTVESSSGMSEELKAKLERKDLMYKAEKIGLEELYEGKVKILQEQLKQSEHHVMSLRAENDQQLDLIQSSRVALSDLRKRYDSGIVSWNEEREHLLKKIRDTDEKLSKLSILEKDMEDVKNKLKKEESKRRESENKLASEKNAWNSERSQLQARVKKEEQSGGKSASTVSEFRAKFEKFGGPAGKGKPGSTGKMTGEEVLDTKVKEESQKLIKNLQTQIKEIEKARESDRKDLQISMDGKEKTWISEKKKLQERNKKLEGQSQELASLQKSLVDLQYKSHEEKEQWSLERNRILKELEGTRKMQLEEKSRINDLLAEIQKLKSVTSSGDTTADTDDKPEAIASGTKVVIAKPVTMKRQTSKDEQITEYVQEVLQRISKLLEDYEKAQPQRRTEKTHAPPSFRRSLSTTEVELGLDSYLYTAPNSSSLVSPTFHQTTHNTPLSTSSSYSASKTDTTDTSVRMRYKVRSMSSTEGDYETKTIDRHVRGRTEKRSSKYLSGTQSASGSRDTSPDTSSERKSAYPLAPPSMIISPSHTPRRAKSKERKPLSKQDMDKLYQKLGEIDYNQEKETSVLAKERGRGVRVLTKSLSVDNTQNEDAVVVKTQEEELSQPSQVSKPSTSRSVGKRFATIAKIHSKKYEDAPLSNTLLASIRLGELVITPGVEELTKKVRKLSKKKSDSTSPHSARKSFFDNYHFSPKSYFSWPKRERAKSVEIQTEPVEKSLHYYESDTDVDTTGRTTDDDSASTSSVTDKSEKKSKFSFFKGVKEKRKLFTIKRSSSVDNSPVHSTVVKAGVQTLPHGAPSTYETPEVPVIEPPKLTSTSSKFKRLSKHQRAASVDASLMMSTGGHSSADIVSSIIAQREEAIARERTKQAQPTESYKTQGKRATSVEPEIAHPQPSPLSLRFTPRSMSARWRSNPSFRLAAEKPVIIKKDPIDRPKEVLNGKLSDSVSSFNETVV